MLHKAAAVIQPWVRAHVLGRQSTPLPSVDRMNPMHTTCPACTGPLKRYEPDRELGYLFIVLCPRCGLMRGGEHRVIECEYGEHLCEEGIECAVCERDAEGPDCDACCAYGNTYVEMRCECSHASPGDHAEKYEEYLKIVQQKAERAHAKKRPRSPSPQAATKRAKVM